ncbi:OmpA family protein [Muribacter muris]|uniref:OmpA family protein n=1 Tax=Muribacter muris TaxID=67855 RepID=UPI00069E4564|nr:OmpA family protein [Muribacter muris]
MKKTLLCASLALALSACSTSRVGNQPLEAWENFKTSTISMKNLGDEHALVVFYRQDDIQGPAVNVFVNGAYQASLLPNALSPVAVCADKNLLSSSFSSASTFGNRKDGVQHTFPSKEVTYIKLVQESNGKLSFVKVNSQDAQNAISHLPQVNQTLSRVIAPRHCLSVLANESLDASALFAFNKSSYQDILPAGKKSIAEFANRIPTLGSVTKITVAGHTDPSGSEHYNQVLSQKRAETVKMALINAGVNAQIDALGYGKSQPIVTHCEALKGKAKQECNQPNRRVEITVYGNK